MGKQGYTIDYLVSVEMVTATGEVLTASEEENAELFWGPRGGAGNFGVATCFEYALHEVGPTVQGGLIAYPIEQGPAALRHLAGLAAAEEDEHTVICSLSHAPDGSGRKVAAMLVCHCGEVGPAAKALAGARSLGQPLIERLGVDRLLRDQRPAGPRLSTVGAELLEDLLSR